MKKLLLIFTLVSSFTLNAQVSDFKIMPEKQLEHMGKMGNNNSSLLNSYESEYFNYIFKDYLPKFDFTNKKIGFIYRGAKSDKKEYFIIEKERFKNKQSPNGGTLFIFNDEEKKKSGGYDAVILYWNKILMKPDEIIKKLN